MMMLAKVAWRNLGRNRRRSLITGAAIALGLGLLIFSSGMGDGFHNAMIRTGVRQMAGHVVVQGQGYQDSQDAAITVPDSARVVATLQEAFPEALVVQRVFVEGLLTSPGGSSGVSLVAVSPEVEAGLTDLDDKLIEGAYLDGDSQVVIGAALAKSLGVGLGDKLVLMSQHGGDIQSQLFRVQGIFKTGMADLDGFYGHIPIGDAQRMLKLGGDVTQISLHFDDAAQTEVATQRAQGLVAGRGVEVLPWQKALPELHQFVILDDAGLYLFILIIAVIVTMGILNTVLMSVLERVKELGVMLALGMSPAQVGGMVLIEALLLGGAAAAVGVVLGLAFNWPLAVYGLDFASIAGGEGMESGGVTLDTLIYSDLSPVKVALFAAISLALTVVASIYPAWRASRLEPVEALGHS